MKLRSSIIAITALSTMSFAGGDIGGITTFENEDLNAAQQVVVEEPKVEVPAVVAPVVAEALGLYVGGAITDIAVNSADRANLFGDEVGQERQVGLTGIIGYDFMNYLGAELRGTVGVAKDNGTKFKQIGAYLKPNYDITDEINIYALLGASRANMNPNGTETGFSYGAGLDYGISDNVSVFTDAVNYMKKSDTNSQWGLNLGAKYQF
jgi:opacity protein-like surface antigen